MVGERDRVEYLGARGEAVAGTQTLLYNPAMFSSLSGNSQSILKAP